MKEISISLDLLSIIFIFLSFGIYFANGKNKDKLFVNVCKLATSICILLLADILYVIFKENTDSTNVRATFYFFSVIFIAKTLIFFFWSEYVGNLIAKNDNYVNLYFYYNRSALLVNLLIIFINFFQKILFIIDANGRFCPLFGFGVFYVLESLSVLLAFVFIFRYRNKTSKNLFLLLSLIQVPCLISEIMYFIFPSISFKFCYAISAILLLGVFEQFSSYREIDRIIDDAIKNKSFEIFYQPIYSVKNQKYTACEALLRLYDNNLGFISPEKIIAVAEENGRINSIFNIVIEECCKFIKSDDFINSELEYININLSMLQMEDSNFIGKFLGQLRKYGVQPSNICVEITETVFSDKDELVLDNVNQLNEVGIQIALDDYGSGLSNLYRMAILPFSLVKLDKFLIQGIEDPKIKSITKSTMDMLNTMQLKTVAEGVETSEQLIALTDLNVDYIQGFYFSRPMPREEFINFLSNSENINV